MDSKREKQHSEVGSGKYSHAFAETLVELTKQQWNSQTFGAWCRHGGDYSTKARAQESWNSKLLEPVAEDLKMPWQTFDAAWKMSLEKCLDSLTTSVDSIGADLKGMLQRS